MAVNESKKLVKIDKNGTEYYEVVEKCYKCGGAGYLGCFHHVENGLCFECNGTGFRKHVEKIYTKAYAEKLEAKRKAKAEAKLEAEKAKAGEVNAKFFEMNGFNAEGKTFAVLGNTYSVKEQLKEAGFHWNNVAGAWMGAQPIEGFETIELDVSELYFADYRGYYDWKNWLSVNENKGRERVAQANEAIKQAMKADEAESNYVGNVGEKVEVKVKVARCFGYESVFGVGFINTMVDESNNQFVWKTGVALEEGSDIIIKGTVKEHSEYKGTKQTVLTRCKVAQL